MNAMFLFLATATSPSWAEAPLQTGGGGAAVQTSLDGEVAGVVRDVQAKYADVTVLRATFVQTKTSALYGEEKQQGSVVLRRPSQMNWVFDNGSQFVTDGATMWIHNPAEKQVLRFRDFGDEAATANSLLQSLHKVGELFDVQMLEGPGPDGPKLALSPRDEASRAQVKGLVLDLDADLVLERLVITDAFDGVTDIVFGDVQLGGTVSDDTFQFEIPPGVEIIDAG